MAESAPALPDDKPEEKGAEAQTPQLTLQQLFVGLTAFAITLGLVASLHPPPTGQAPPPVSLFVVAVAYATQSFKWRLCFSIFGMVRIQQTVGTFLVNIEPEPPLLDDFLPIAFLLIAASKIPVLIAYSTDREPLNRLHRLGVYAALEEVYVGTLASCCPIPL